MKNLVDKLEITNNLTKDEFLILLENHADNSIANYLFKKAQALSREIFGNNIYIRGLIEFTNYCCNDCYYCGIRKSNQKASRYLLSQDEILDCCQIGYKLGFRTFVLQSGETSHINDQTLTEVVAQIKKKLPECAITLSCGEKSYQTYLNYFQAGADRYLLRHETANPEHYKKLHPQSLSLEKRKKCLYDLKKIGYQTGTGFMVGSPYQKLEYIAEDLLFIKELNPEMIGIGPFIPHQDTPFANFPPGNADLTVYILALLRLMLTHVLLPATTALGTLDPKGREKAILAGANVIMPNLSPVTVRNKYMLYNNKIHTNEEAAEGTAALEKLLNNIGYKIAIDRGDYASKKIT